MVYNPLACNPPIQGLCRNNMGFAFLSPRRLRLRASVASNLSSSTLLLIFAACHAVNVFAETSGVASPLPSASSPAAVPASTSASPAPPEAYVDRVMDGVSQQDQTSDSNESYDTQGWARGLSVQFTRNVQTSKSNNAFLLDTRTETQGFQLDTYLEAPNFGTLSLQALKPGILNLSGPSVTRIMFYLRIPVFSRPYAARSNPVSPARFRISYPR